MFCKGDAMKIGYYINRFPYKDHSNDTRYVKQYWCSGAENVAYYLAINIAQKGNKISIFTTSIDSKPSIEKYENIDIYRHSTNFRIMNRNISFSLFLEATEYQIDILHAHLTNSPNDFAVPRYTKGKNIPLIVTYHGDPERNMGGIIYKTGVVFYAKYILDKVLSHADVIISPSGYYISESRFLGKYRDKIVVIPNGINIEDFDIPYSKEECRDKLGLPIDENMILFVGILSPYKGPDVLVRAMPEISKKNRDTKLVFVGSGGMREELEKLCKKTGVEKNVKFAGFVEENLKPLYYRAADVFCLPSTMSTESFGIVNLEAMACGVPIVASKIGGIPDVVKDGENGLLVPPRDSGALADVIIYLLENEDIRERMGKNGRKKVEDYSWEKIAEETENVYETVLK
jgi:glycosyltransferase involved in cell wall biosynthesis